MDLQSADKLLDAAAAMSMPANEESGRERTRLNFANAVTERFGFLDDLGFSVLELLPTIVRYGRSDIVVDVYHGRQSYELDLGIERSGVRYSLSELIRTTDPHAVAQYRNFAATTPSGIAEGLTRLAELVKRYGKLALQGDAEFFIALEKQRAAWAEGYALDVLAEQIRPKAETAFREGHYQEAADLHEKIAPRLSPAERQKLAVARKRM